VEQGGGKDTGRGEGRVKRRSRNAQPVIIVSAEKEMRSFFVFCCKGVSEFRAQY
jgi:hypothetical protein